MSSATPTSWSRTSSKVAAFASARQHSVVLKVRGHGFAAGANTLIEVLKLAAALPRNARVLMDAIRLGGTVTPLSSGEVALRAKFDVRSPAAQRQLGILVAQARRLYARSGGY